MRKTTFLPVAFLLLGIGATPTTTPAQKMVARRETAIKHATESYWKSRVAADKQLVDDLTNALRALLSHPENSEQRPELTTDLATAQSQLDSDIQSEKENAELTTPAAAVAAAKEKEKRDLAAAIAADPSITPEIRQAIADHQIAVGMTLPQAELSIGSKAKLVSGSGDEKTYSLEIWGAQEVRGGGIAGTADASNIGGLMAQGAAVKYSDHPGQVKKGEMVVVVINEKVDRFHKTGGD